MLVSIFVVGFSRVVGVGMKVADFSMAVRMEVNAITNQPAQHIHPQQYQHNPHCQFQYARELLRHQTIHHQHQTAKEKEGQSMPHPPKTDPASPSHELNNYESRERRQLPYDLPLSHAAYRPENREKSPITR